MQPEVVSCSRTGARRHLVQFTRITPRRSQRTERLIPTSCSRVLRANPLVSSVESGCVMQQTSSSLRPAPLRLRVENPEHETRSRAVVSCHIRSKSVFHPCQSVARLLLNPPTSMLCHRRLCHADLILCTEYSVLRTSLSPSLAHHRLRPGCVGQPTNNSIAPQPPLKCRTILTYIT